MAPSRLETQNEDASPASVQVPLQGKVLSPISLAHVVFRTSNYDKMVNFWVSFLGATIAQSSSNLTFIRYDDEHHRIAIIAVPDATPRNPTAAGLHHVAFSFSSLNDLVNSYQQRKALGILPIWSVNHGPTTSIYYDDPDHNLIETQVDNFETIEEANTFMQSEMFKENAIGTDFDPEELVKMLQSGVSEEVIKRRVEIGPRGLPDGF